MMELRSPLLLALLCTSLALVACGGPTTDLEVDQTASAAVASGTIVAAGQNVLVELTPTGVLTGWHLIPYPGGNRPQGELARGVAVTASGRVGIFNGTSAPYLTEFDGTTWSHRSAAGWNTTTDSASGKVAALGETFFATDAPGVVQPGGLVRFRPRSSADRPITGASFTDVELGLDGRLYVLASPRQIRVYDATSSALVRTVALPVDVRTIAADSRGDVFAGTATGVLYHFNPTGLELAHTQTSTNGAGVSSDNINDLALTRDEKLVVGTRGGGVRLFNVKLSEERRITAIAWGPVFVSVAP